MTRRVAVVGGGISGLVAAYRLRVSLGPDAEIVLVESSDRLGGAVRTADFGAGPLDVGAEAFLGRRPEVPALLRELGLAEQLVHPSGARPLIYSAGHTHPLPAGTLMGIPHDAESVDGLVDSVALSMIADEPSALRWDRGQDSSVAELVGRQFGEQVVRRSVDPLLGGVYSGLSTTIGVRAALPTLAAALDAGAATLKDAVRAALPAPRPGPVFGGLRDGYAVLIDALIAAADARILLGTSVRSLTPSSTGWHLDTLGDVDAVVLAVPAPTLARVLADVAPDAASAAAEIEIASSVVVALALPLEAALPQNSGVLVATDAGLDVKAFTLSSRKWPHLAERDLSLVRASLGRFGDDAVLGLSDTELVDIAVADLQTVTGLDVRPSASFVQRWHGGLPQYAPGHLDQVAAIHAGIADRVGLAVTGAWNSGVGVPACIASATAAAARIVPAT